MAATLASHREKARGMWPRAFVAIVTMRRCRRNSALGIARGGNDGQHRDAGECRRCAPSAPTSWECCCNVTAAAGHSWSASGAGGDRSIAGRSASWRRVASSAARSIGSTCKRRGAPDSCARTAAGGGARRPSLCRKSTRIIQRQKSASVGSASPRSSRRWAA